MPKQYVWVDYKELNPYQLSGDPDTVVRLLTEHIQAARANPEFTDVRLDGHPDRYAECSCEVLYLQVYRLETDRECQVRIQDEQYRKEWQDRVARQQYEELKKRFEGGK
jgi:hypothetical protein